MRSVKADPAVTKYFERESRAEGLFYALIRACAAMGDPSFDVQKSDIALGSPRHYGYAWLPVHPGADRPPVYLVLTLRLKRRIDSPRVIQIVEPYPGRYAHHLILSAPAQLDQEFLGWVREAKADSLEK